MKKSLVLMAMASVALASCVNDVADVVQNQEQKKVKITFDTPVLYNNAESRAGFYGEIGSHQYVENGVTYSYPREESFQIYAVSHSSTFAGWTSATVYNEFNNTSVSYDWNTGLDGWAPKTSAGGYYYWPDGYLSFAACSPANLELNEKNEKPTDESSTDVYRYYDNQGLTIKNFQVASDATKQYDLMFSERIVNQESDDMKHVASDYSGIPIRFQHALSSIRFSVRNKTLVPVVLTSIEVKGVKYKGDFSENITEDADDYTRYERDGTDPNVAPEWTVKDDIISTPYTAFKGNVTFPENPRYVSDLTTEANKLLGDGANKNICHQLLLMPQELTDKAELTVNYLVQGQPQTKTVDLELQKAGDTPTPGEGVTDSRPTIKEWKMGKRYIYRLVYDSSTADKDKIYFAPSSDNWDEVTVIEVIL